MKAERVYIIAEAGVNHNGDLEIAKKLIDAAVEAGADAVKFQSFKAEELASSHAEKAEYQLVSTGGRGSQLDMLRQLELDHTAHQVLFEHCRKKRICFLSTPFDSDSVDMLESLGVSLFKIGSGDLTNIPLLRYLARKEKPLILSTGMSNLHEVQDALDTIYAEGNKNVTLLHCVSEYPAPIDQVNLLAMVTMKNHFKVEVGFSDHTLGIEAALAAVALGASVIEKHLTLSREMNGPDHRASLEPLEMKQLVKSIKNVSAALGNGVKQPAPCEVRNIDVARRSLFAAVDIPAGEIIREDKVKCKRPGTGISPRCYDELIGLKVSRDFKAGEMLSWDGIPRGNDKRS
jgi:N,N'-diacetyllegionaminate synthase